MTEPRGDELIARYRQNYLIPLDVDLTEEMILAHWELEKRLTDELLASSPTDRWETSERCYSTLYGKLEWLNNRTTAPSPWLFRPWVDLIGRPPQSVYEIGSGKGELIGYLASRGFECCATEITHLRGQNRASSDPNLTWKITDGVHLDKFVSIDSFDVVISDQLIEHLHPDDLADHLLGVSRILKSGGRYIFCTPHAYSGPWDVSRVFKYDEPRGMHLREYTYQELSQRIQEVGAFRSMCAVLRMPTRVSQATGGRLRTRASGAYLTYLRCLEKCIRLSPRPSVRREVARLARWMLFLPDIFMVAQT